ncbi:glycosyltransferase [uncultured Tateyamaria sp.]|uniref:glycosyltransferase family 2 protein n=1 Tax=Tateyamaria sp. 1078 TaxID=3417464 RepID=UPI002611BDFA|nr:glycosyltransferase [uncultured Tateyamaria sp.]
MSEPLPVSVVVVSRDRPEALKRCLEGVAQLQYPQFEVVVVADAAGVAAAQEMPFADNLKTVLFERANISQARNLGISHAAGEVVAFIDDDAVPEPSWLTYLIRPFDKPEVACAGGFVRARNGISYQWEARSIDARGVSEPVDVNHSRVTVFRPKGGRAIKTEGTNMAVRRDILVTLEGFDPGFAFFLDETDLNLRIMRAGHATAIVPMAEVHHGYQASPRRRPDRVPRDLFDIGASWAVFQRKYIPERERLDHWHPLRLAERRRLVSHVVAGRLEPGDVRRLMRRLDQGYGQGLARHRGGAQVSASAVSAFRAMPVRTGAGVVLTGRSWQRARLRREAAQRAEQGERVTLILLSPTALYHRVSFMPAGYWEQRGGLWGRSERDAALVRFQSFRSRVRREVLRVAQQRLISL